MFISLKNKAFYLKTILFIILSNVIAVNPAQAFSVTFDNTGFEDSGDGNDTGGFTGWTTTGDTSIQSSFQTISPISGSYQALITNGCPGTAQTGECFDSNNPSVARNDDNPTTAGEFNYSGNDQISASVQKPDLQTFFGLSGNDLSIARENGISSGNRTPKEGSGIKQDITIVISNEDVANGTNGFKLNFNWGFLTNDANNVTAGDQDFAFFSFYDTASSPGDIIVLADSDNSNLPTPTADDFAYDNLNYYVANNQYDYSVSGLSAGTYTYNLGLGVVDVDNVDRSSALLVDNFNVQQVPFEFSPTAGIALMLGLFGCDRLRRRMKIKNQKLRINQV